jgi:diaminopimelate decarboxylase
VCESGDFLARGRALPPLARGDLLAVHSAGAYGFVMASNYNGRPRAAEVLVRGDRFAVVREREQLSDLVRGESVPEDLVR